MHAQQNWIVANISASNEYYLGKQGYLATLTTPQEHNFILSKVPLNFYYVLGATDIESPGMCS